MPRTRWLVWLGFIGAVLVVMGLKAWQLGWFQTKAPLVLDGRPAVLVFVKKRGICECEQVVIDNAHAQIDGWSENDRQGLPIHQIEMDLRPGLARQYDVIRVPSLLVLDASGQIVWRQDGVTKFTSDEYPLDLDQVQNQIAALLQYQQQESE